MTGSAAVPSSMSPEPNGSASEQRGPEGDLGAEPGSESIEALSGRAVVPLTSSIYWTKEHATAAKRAPLRIYLGAAPGVGKTFAMLSEGIRRKDRGSDVVIGLVETYGRPKTIELAERLEVVPARSSEYRGIQLKEMDAEAVIARDPGAALVDELAHTNVPDSRRAKRWEDVIDILAEGIEVISTVNVQHVESLNDVIANITEIRQKETVPDWVIDLADQVELVDMSPQALQKRMMHGNVYPDPRKAELALRRFFTIENLTALRDLALMRVANRVDDELLDRWTKDRSVPDTRERVLVCVERSPLVEDLVRRGARIAQRAKGELLVLHVHTPEEKVSDDWLVSIQELVASLGGDFDVISADSDVDGVLGYSYRQNVTQIVVGESHRSRWEELFHGSFINRLIRKASEIDVHVISRTHM
jgi:two-component system, OmpR family, sensor histidine kinase KdpD